MPLLYTKNLSFFREMMHNSYCMLKNWIIAPEFVAILVMMVLAAYAKGSMDSHSHQDKLFYYSLVVSMLVTFENIISCLFIVNVFIHPLWLYALCQHVFFLITPAMPMMICLYVLKHLNEKMGEKTDWKYYFQAIGILYLLYSVGVILDWVCEYGWFFRLDESGVYRRGPYNGFTVYVSLSMIFIVIVYTIQYRKLLPFSIKRIIQTFELLFIALVLGQLIYPNLQIAGTAAMLALLIFYVNFHMVALTTDSLTKLPNSEQLVSFLSFFGSKNRRFTIVAINIRGFKRFNQEYGLNFGNKLLTILPDRLKEVPHSSFLCRFNNDRFVIIGPDMKSNEWDEFFDVLNYKLEEPFILDEFYFPLSVDFDLVTIKCPDYAATVDDMVSMISFSLSLPAIRYEQVRDNSHVFYLSTDDSIRKSIFRREYVHSVLRDALETGKLKCAYQPIFDSDGKYVGMSEALARLYDENENEYIPPAEFIPIAEANGMINKVGKIILLKALTFISDEVAKGHEAPVISLNFSFLQFYNEHLVDAIIDTVKAYNVPSGCLKIEITESNLDSAPDIKTMMERFIAAGITFYLDDFGTGYSSFDRLFRLPFEKAKFDRDILLEVTNNVWTRRMVSSLMESFRAYGMKIVFEGVETEEQLKIVRELQADYVQGFFFAHPILEDEFSAWIDTQYPKAIN
jgi:FOG: EAL domain